MIVYRLIVYRLISAGALLHLANAKRGNAGNPFGGPIDTCFEQNNCFDITVNALSENTCDLEGTCFYEACIELDFENTNCEKTDSLSHSCDKSFDNNCPRGNTLWDENEAKSVISGTPRGTQCQIGVGGSTLQFIYKDGRACAAAGDAAAGNILIGGTGAADASATCRPSISPDVSLRQYLWQRNHRHPLFLFFSAASKP